MLRYKIYIAAMIIAALAMAVVFNFFPRSVYSPLEKRELARRPAFTPAALLSGDYARGVEAWFSDSEPFRDELMTLSMVEKDALRLPMGGDNITFHAPAPVPAASAAPATPTAAGNRHIDRFNNTAAADEIAKIGNRGIIVIGTGAKTRALMAFGGGRNSGLPYAQAANLYKRTFGSGVNVYCMAIPTATDYYIPPRARSRSNEERLTINNIYAHLDGDVVAVDVYTALGRHAAEDIFLRTDHHWAPLGAFYAAQEFARVAHVPFKPLSAYTRHVVHRFVGSMYGYSKDISLRNNPEDFVYYTPNGVAYTTTYTDYTIDKNYRVTSEGRPHKGNFFYHYKDGNGGAYCTFMGADFRITRVSTGTKNHRRLLLLKDSFGNALPGYLFYSFEEIHVVDFRYFTKNMRQYVEQNKITDILFAHNVFNVCSGKIYNRYAMLLSQHWTRPVATAQPAEAPAQPAEAATAAPAAHKAKSHADTAALHVAAPRDSSRHHAEP